MSIEKANFDLINEEDLQELVDAQMVEGLRLEFKSSVYKSSDKDKFEFLKDVSAFANSYGGSLVLGLEESEGVATGLKGVEVNSDKELLRMEQLIRNGTEPPISGTRMLAIPLSNGMKVLLLRVPKSWNPPHRVSVRGKNKFYLRNSAGVHETSMEEMRSLFSQSATNMERAKQFRNSRINAVIDGEGHRPLFGNGRFFIHIVPTAAFSGMVHIDVEKAFNLNKHFSPLSTSTKTPEYNFHGFINSRGGDNNCGYTQIFRNGAIEATLSDIIIQSGQDKVVIGENIEGFTFPRLSSYLSGLKSLEVPPPFIIMFTFEGVKGVHYAPFATRGWGMQPPLPNNLLFLPECVLDDYGDKLKYHQTVRPAFDALWNAIGFVKAQFFDEKGIWVGPPRR